MNSLLQAVKTAVRIVTAVIENKKLFSFISSFFYKTLHTLSEYSTGKESIAAVPIERQEFGLPSCFTIDSRLRQRG